MDCLHWPRWVNWFWFTSNNKEQAQQSLSTRTASPVPWKICIFNHIEDQLQSDIFTTDKIILPILSPLSSSNWDWLGIVHLPWNHPDHQAWHSGTWACFLETYFHKGIFSWLAKHSKELTYSELPGDCVKPHMNRMFKVWRKRDLWAFFLLLLIG